MTLPTETALDPAEETRPRPSWARPILAAALIVGLALAVRAGGGFDLDSLRQQLQELGPAAPVAAVALYVVGVLAALPGSVLTGLAGALFGSPTGIAVVACGATLGATLCFLVSRYAARDLVSRWLGGTQAFQRLDRLTTRHGAMVVLIVRLVPLFPFNLANYGFGLTSVPLGTYVLWSFLGMLPGIVVYVVGADALVQALSGGPVPWGLLGILAGGLALVAALAWRARRLLEDPPAPEGDSEAP